MTAAEEGTPKRAPLPLSVALAFDPAAAGRLLRVAAVSDGPRARELAGAAIRAESFREIFRECAERRGLPGDL